MKTATTPNRPGTAELVDEINVAASGIGLWTTTLFGIVPGFIPIVALTIVGLAIFVVPIVVLIAMIALPLLAVRVACRLIARASNPKPRFTTDDGDSLPMHDADRLAVPMRQSRSGAAA